MNSNNQNTVPETEVSENTAQAENEETCKEGGECEKSACKKKKKNDDAAKKLLAEYLEENEKLKKELSEQKDMHLRMLAEYDNFRKRTSSEKSAIYADTKAEVVEKFLPVLDNLERAAGCSAETENDSAIREGVSMVLRSFGDIFEKLGVSEIPAMGEQFDPNVHNAVMKEDNPDVGENVITEVFQKGYRIGDKVIRYSMVKVAN
ncbi:MAG: nucleotide exchange factor GrpE [Clostridia bacterium]|nr:nucleotide exchange factor GrpE [Clostridia bacterium]